MRTSRIRLTLAVPLMLLALAGCGGSGDGPGVATAGGGGGAGASAAPSASLDNLERQRRFAQCMRDNGVDMPDPDPAGGGPRMDLPEADNAKLTAAMEKCRDLLPNGGESRQLSPEEAEKYQKFAGCMREHGVELPDPDPATGRITVDGGLIGSIDPGSQKFKDAMAACKQFRPGA